MTRKTGCVLPDKKAFTLIEVLSVLVFLSILTLSVIQSYEHSVKKEKEDTLRRELAAMRSAIDRYYCDALVSSPQQPHEKRFPKSLQELYEKKYLRAIPRDPLTGTDAWEILFVSENEKRVFDVKSKALGAASDNTLYSAW